MRISNNISILFLLIILYSCEKKLDYQDLNFKPQLVLNGLIYQDSIISINISKTKSILDADSILPFVENAKVGLYENDIYIEELTFDSLGIYHSKARARANKNYKIDATVDGIKTATAKFSFKNSINYKLGNINYQIQDTILHIDKPIKADTNLLLVNLNFDIIFNDNAEEENYYDFGSYGKFYNIIHELGYSSESEYEETIILSEANSLYLSFRNYNDADKFYPDGRSSFNGYKQNWYINDQLFNGKEVIFGLTTTFCANNLDSIEVVLFSYPYEYIYFHKTGYRYISTQDNPFSQPINIYSNIENGLGLVCAVTCYKQVIYP